MNLLIIYGTVEGQTRKIATHVADLAKSLGHNVTMTNAEETSEVDLDGVGAVILAASVHQRRHPRHFEALVQGAREGLAACPTLMMSVSLSAAFPEGLEEAGEYLTEMKMRTGFEPAETLLVAGAIRTDHYDYFSMQVVRFVVMRGRPFDASAGTHEFTDWKAVDARVTAFLEKAG
ncbi:flavodoxin domain-containing protein [Ovoidimarina sediminis]|uniref:flavodoxin domain-containing protein n=1 Tax=Ovoidimarina sediminis TaxID=3079856 RepID=UPI00290B34A6|nr:flavodoxin domain-containing protein [Rhodophyticola sp. MJ-SS7]MDU8942675.1 flavodoxin domain-containing protein [Rhodophyticola sp. MJ-SS7]